MTVKAKRAADTVGKVYEEIRRMAINYEFRPEARINEVELGGKFGVSRTPIREALNRLVIEGLITLVPNKGFYCRSLTQGEIFDLYELRSGLELAAAKAAVQRADLSALQSIASDWEQVSAAIGSQNSLAIAIADERFHERIAASCGNVELLAALRLINARLRFARRIVIEMRDPEGVVSEHRDIAAALIARDSHRACEILERHVALSRDDALSVTREGFARIYTRA